MDPASILNEVAAVCITIVKVGAVKFPRRVKSEIEKREADYQKHKKSTKKRKHA